jgi:hypothetical protein
MSCVVTSGYAIECRDSVGGIEIVYLIENSALYDASGNSRVTSASGVVTALAKNTGKSLQFLLFVCIIKLLVIVLIWPSENQPQQQIK